MPILFDGSLLADYHQFYLADAAGNVDLPTNWNDDALNTRLLSGPGVLIVATERNMTVPVRVILHERRPQIDIDAADHVVEGHLHTSGEIVIAGLNDYLPQAPRRRVPAGELGVMIIFTGLDTLSEDGLDGEDRYDVHLWPGSVEGITVLRQWQGA
ncbi:hypothetical protein [uncultured Oxalicibacterium sp.]|uniref:hypothetical protein n=1 Tax=uncultured Oxalicibacterium sp. TaxID=1168540 RepID=UPI0025E551E3|nr:hypothetical protein [uncultured Oxalicibacterium sp.]